jgi:dienelactone hydrolase
MKTPTPRLITVLIAGVLALAATARAMTEQERRAHLDWMQKNLPPMPASSTNAGTGAVTQTPAGFDGWQSRTGELPPDFDSFPRDNYLPDPLSFLNGKAVKSASDWAARRAEIKQLFEKYDIGTMPPAAKYNKVTVDSETKGEGYFTRVVTLTYGPNPDNERTLVVTLTIPDGNGPFPVLMGGTPASLIRRGYIAAAYNQSVDIPNEAPLGLQKLYPQYDFYSMGQTAWQTQLVVDYLFTLPQVDKAKIAVTGYSRTGKMAMIAAAWDERIAAVVAGSTGVGGSVPWRLAGEYGAGEGVESTTRSFPVWFHPRLRFFSGHEDRLPIDANLLAALIAPRAILMEYGLNDEVANTWAQEQTYASARKVFSLLKQPDRIGLLRVPGFHGSNDVEAYLDWLDIQFGRSNAQWDNKLLFAHDRTAWLRESGEKIDPKSYPVVAPDAFLQRAGKPIATAADWETQAAAIRSSVTSMLGQAPASYTAPARGGAGAGRGGAAGAVGRAGAAAPGAAARGGAAPAGRGAAPAAGRGAVAGPNPGQLKPDVPAWVIQRGGTSFGWFDPSPTNPAKSLAAQRNLTFGYNVAGTIYYPNNTPAGTKLPVAIWLHGYSYPLGYMWVYRTDLHPILALVQAGYAVLAYDQIGFGSRMGDFAPFYDRQPKWSLMGQMVDDVRKAVDTLSADAALDPERISVFGYSIGGTVGLYAAALDPRIKSVVAIGGFTPMRTDTANRGLGGLARYSEVHPFIPKLGFFIGQESRLPYDFPELIAAIAPRPVLVVEPTMDRAAAPAEVRQGVVNARRAYALYNASDKLALDEPVDYLRLTTATQDRAVKWMNAIHHPAPVPFTPAAP